MFYNHLTPKDTKKEAPWPLRVHPPKGGLNCVDEDNLNYKQK